MELKQYEAGYSTFIAHPTWGDGGRGSSTGTMCRMSPKKTHFQYSTLMRRELNLVTECGNRTQTKWIAWWPSL